MLKRFGLMLAVAIALVVAGDAQAQTAFGTGNLVVLRVADRTDAVAIARAVEIREYATSTTSLGTAVQTVAVPSSSSATNRFTIVGNSTAGGSLSLNPNGTVTFAGYRAASGDTTPNGATSATVNRVIGSLDLATGIVNTNVGLTGAFSTLSFRSAATSDGQTFYLSGANGTTGSAQIATVTGGLPATVTTIATTTALTTSTSNNLRNIQVANGNLFVASGSATPGQQIHQIGSGTPTTGSQALTASFGNQGSTNQYNSFTLARLGTGTSWNSTGFDTIYAVDNDNATGSTVQKWSFNGTNWSAAGTISVVGANNIAIRQNATSVDLFVTTQTSTVATLSTIQAITDTSGFGGTLTGSFTTILTGTGNEGFLGVAFTPVPEPGTVLAISAAAVVLVGAVRRRRRGEPVLA